MSLAIQSLTVAFIAHILSRVILRVVPRPYGFYILSAINIILMVVMLVLLVLALVKN